MINPVLKRRFEARARLLSRKLGIRVVCQRNKPSLFAIAKHEAGHAVVAVATGIIVARATLMGNRSHVVAIPYDPDTCNVAMAAMAVAGSVSEGNCHLGIQDAEVLDSNLCAISAIRYREPRQFVAESFATAQRILQTNTSATRSVTTELMRKRHLSRSEIVVACAANDLVFESDNPARPLLERMWDLCVAASEVPFCDQIRLTQIAGCPVYDTLIRLGIV